ncbi:Retrovirus-related Pol polyprotein from transposon RE1 [Vitis vinifera]|uniref:Retrovirus-related Pol polyprotein from transposon RE1 n=1 Tax=Vitis vinifera TaxID=29760 RepID=A0A438BZS5_VITVI|nr:Retrovirus-related Pol polyprotein from transposon RE1 [Vitis vinifera]
MTTKNQIFTSVLSGSPLITSEKLEADIPEVDRVQWRKIDAQLCSVLWQSVDPRILLHLQAYKTCFKFWTQAKGLYTNDIQRLYKVASAIVHLSQQDLDLSTYIGQIASLKEQFLTVMPLTPDVGAQQTQLDKFFMVLTLIGLRPDLEPIRDQILGSSSVPSLDDVFARLLLVPEVEANVLIAPIANKLGHTRDRCYQLHGRPPRTAHMAQSSDSPLSQPPSSSASQTSQASIASVAQPGNASACLTHTSSLGPWILDSGASDHLSGNKDLFSSITTTSDLPTVTLANGSQTVAKGIGLALPLPSLPLTSVLYTPECPFNLISISKITRTLNCSITFSDKFVTLQDRSTGKTIGIGQDGSSFSTLSSLPCESCQLGKHTRVSFPKRLNNRAKSPFELVHTDVWGPCRTASTLGFQYFVTFIDDYSRCLSSSPRVVAPLPFPEAPADSLPIPSASPAPALPSPNDLPIAVRKSTHEALSHPGWRQAMVDEMAALHSNGTWDLVVLPSGPFSAKGYTQVYGSDYGDTFSPVAKIASVRLLLSMAAMYSWPLYQLDIKNAFLHGDLAEEVYMEQPPGFVAQGESGLVCRLRRSLYGLKQSPRAWFSRFSSVVQEFGMLRSSDQDGIQKLKQHLFTHFQTKDLGKLKYFLGIEIAQSSSGVVLSQRKYALDILEETGMLDCKPVDTPMDPNVKLAPGQGEPLGDPGDIDGSHWDAVIRILRYIKSTPGQGVLYENRGHTQVVGYTDADWAGSPTDRRSTSGYCVFIGGNLISWKSKKQDVVARSSAEAEYRAMALATCELIWLRHLLQELRFGKDEQMKLICDNQAALHIASNPVFHERTKHIEVDCHFIREKIASGCVATSFVNSNDQLADIFTKSLRGPRIKYICNKLGAYDVYAPA